MLEWLAMTTRRRTPAAARVTATATAMVLRDDDALVERAIAHVRGLARRGLLETAVAIGDYLVATFFDGDLELARSRRPTKPAALSRFLERADETEIAASLLRRSIALSAQYRSLPAPVRDRLSVSQHTALLPVDDAREKARLAAEAVARGLSKKEIEGIVRRDPEHAPTRGRPPRSHLEKAVGAARRALSALIEGELTAARLRKLPPEVREGLARDLHAIRERSERIADALLRPR